MIVRRARRARRARAAPRVAAALLLACVTASTTHLALAGRRLDAVRQPGARVAAPESPGRPVPATLAHFDLRAARDATLIGSEVLAADSERRDELSRWLYEGGRLRLVGEAAEPAARVLGGLPTGRTTVPLGMGRIAVGPAAPGFAPESARSADPLLAELAASTRAASRGPGAARLPLALRLAVWAALLGIAVGYARSPARSARGLLAALGLAALFAAWPFVERLVPGHAGRVVELNVVLDAGPSPPLVWGAAFIDATRRSAWRLDPGPGSWNVALHGATALAGTPELDAARGDHPVGIETTRGARAGLSWLARGGLPGSPRLVLSREGDRVAGVVRNASDRRWTDLWLLVPGMPARRLDDVAPRESRVFAHDGLPEDVRASRPAHPGAPEPWTEDALRIAWRDVVEPRLARGESVLVAWSAAPARPLHIEGARPRRSGMSLLVHVIGEDG